MVLIQVLLPNGTPFPKMFVGQPQGDYQGIIQADGSVVLIPKDSIMICTPITPPPEKPPEVADVAPEEPEIAIEETEPVESPPDGWEPATVSYGCTIPPEEQTVMTSAERRSLARKKKP